MVKIAKQPSISEIQVGDKLIIKAMAKDTKARVGIEVMHNHIAFWKKAESITGEPYFADGEIISLYRNGAFIYDNESGEHHE